jgi:hypothetical protein
LSADEKTLTTAVALFCFRKEPTRVCTYFLSRCAERNKQIVHFKVQSEGKKEKKTAARSHEIETAKGLLVGVSILKLQKLQSAWKFCHLLP